MLLDFLLYEGEHQSIQVQNAVLTRAFRHERDKNKLRLIVPLARRAADKRIGRHFSINHRFKASPNTKDGVAFDHADVISDQLIPATDFKAQQDTLLWEIYTWLVTCGVCFEHCDWKEAVTQDVMPKYDEATGDIIWKDSLTEQEIPERVLEQLVQSGRVAPERFSPSVEVQAVGDFGADIYDPFRVFVDASVKQVKFLGPDQAIYLADIRTFDWIKATFGNKATAKLTPSKQLSIIETQLIDRGVPVSGVNLKDLLPLIQGSQGKDDPDSCIVLTRYQPQSEENPEGLRSFFVPDQEALEKGDNPYPEVPVVDYHWSAPVSSIWTRGFMRDLQSMSKFINKRFSQLGEASNAQLYELLLTGGDISKRDIPTDFPGIVEGGLSDEGTPLVQTVPRGNISPFFPESIRLSMETLDALSSSDLSSGKKMPAQMRGPLALPLLQEILDSEDGPRYKHLAEQFAREKMMRVNRIKAFYPPIRTLNYTGEDMRTEVLEFHTDEVLRAGVDFQVTVDPGSVFPESASMREARVRERMQWAPGLYTNPRTGTMDWSKVAKDLKYNDKQRESTEVRGRKLARQLLQWVRKGKLTVQDMPQQGMGPDGAPLLPKPTLFRTDTSQSFVTYPFWPHDAMMDEYQDAMETTEFLEASPTYQRALLTLFDSHRAILAQIDQARQQSVDNKMVQSAMAQASQQAAAMAASAAAEAAIQQVQAQGDLGGNNMDQLEQRMRQLLGESQGGQPQRQPQRRPIAPMQPQ